MEIKITLYDLVHIAACPLPTDVSVQRVDGERVKILVPLNPNNKEEGFFLITQNGEEGRETWLVSDAISKLKRLTGRPEQELKRKIARIKVGERQEIKANHNHTHSPQTPQHSSAQT